MQSTAAWVTFVAVSATVCSVIVSVISMRHARQARAAAAEAVAAADRSVAEAQRSASAAERSANAVDVVRGLETRRHEYLAHTPRVRFALDRRHDGWYLTAHSDGPLVYSKVEVSFEEAPGSPFPLERPGFLHPYGEVHVVDGAWNLAVLRPGDHPSVRVPNPLPAGGQLVVRYVCGADDDQWEARQFIFVPSALAMAG